MFPQAKKWEDLSLAEKSLLTSLGIQHVWATIILVAIAVGSKSQLLGELFSTCSYSILANLMMIGGYRQIDKALGRFTDLRAGTVVQEVEREKTTTTASPAAAAPALPPGDSDDPGTPAPVQ